MNRQLTCARESELTTAIETTIDTDHAHTEGADGVQRAASPQVRSVVGAHDELSQRALIALRELRGAVCAGADRSPPARSCRCR